MSDSLVGITSNCANVLPYTYTIHTGPKEPDADCIIIEKCEKGFIVDYKDKEYACESLHSAYEVIKKLFKPMAKE